MASASNTPFFRPALFSFFRELAANNDREWFESQRERYESDALEPALAFVTAFGFQLEQISPHFLAIPRKAGGSLYRIHRDTRFSQDKSPYKTHLGIHFRHAGHKSAHAPGFYLHLQPGSCFMGAGIWRPDSATLRKIRQQLAADPEGWQHATSASTLGERIDVADERLKMPPRGFDPKHPLIEDLKRKDFTCFARLSQKEVTSGDFLDGYAGLCRSAGPFVSYLCRAVEVPF